MRRVGVGLIRLAGNGPPSSSPPPFDPVAPVPVQFQTNLIMPEPTIFLNSNFGPVSIIRPTAEPDGGAMAAVRSFVDDGLFLDPATGTNTSIVAVLMRLAEDADEATRLLP